MYLMSVPLSNRWLARLWRHAWEETRRVIPASLALFLKNWFTLVISRYPPVQELGKRIPFGRPHLYQYSVRRPRFFWDRMVYLSILPFVSRTWIVMLVREMSSQWRRTASETRNPEEYIVAMIALCFRFGVASMIAFISLRVRTDGWKVPFPFHSRNHVIIPKDLQHFFVEEFNC